MRLKMSGDEEKIIERRSRDRNEAKEKWRSKLENERTLVRSNYRKREYKEVVKIKNMREREGGEREQSKRIGSIQEEESEDRYGEHNARQRKRKIGEWGAESSLHSRKYTSARISWWSWGQCKIEKERRENGTQREQKDRVTRRIRSDAVTRMEDTSGHARGKDGRFKNRCLLTPNQETFLSSSYLSNVDQTCDARVYSFKCI